MKARSAFTLVEILIVVVILGILAAIVVPALSHATTEAQAEATYSDLQKMRRAIGVYRAREGAIPPIIEVENDPDASWGPLVGQEGEYMKSSPMNAWVGGQNGKRVVVIENYVPDNAYQTDAGWIFDPISGELYAGSFDAEDRPNPRN